MTDITIDENDNVTITGVSIVANPEPFDENRMTIWDTSGVPKGDVKSVTTSNSVVRLGWEAFYGLSSLLTVIHLGDLTEIGNRAFAGCRSLVTVRIPKTVTKIGWQAFSGCSSLVTVTIPDGVISIGSGAFRECVSLVNVTIPGSVTSIGQNAFLRCRSLESINISESVTTVEEWAFQECDSLTTITISAKTKIRQCVFDYCKSLKYVLIKPDSSTPNASLHINCLVCYKESIQIWAPDSFVKRFDRRFERFSTIAEVPRAMRAAPDATTWTAAQLWLDWSDPQSDAGDERVLNKSRKQMVWTVIHVAERLENMPSEMWLLIMTFVKHE